MKKDHYTITLQKLQECLECGEDFRCNKSEIKNTLAAFKHSVPERIKHLEKVINSVEIAHDSNNKNTLAMLKQTPKDIVRTGDRMLKNARSIATHDLQPLIKEFNDISRGFAADYVALLKRKGIK